jgi:hypothetical protein
MERIYCPKTHLIIFRRLETSVRDVIRLHVPSECSIEKWYVVLFRRESTSRTPLNSGRVDGWRIIHVDNGEKFGTTNRFLVILAPF